MATPLNTIKNWFKTGLFPTQAQFWSAFESFWHKDEAIPMNSVDGLGDALNSKASNSALSSKLDKGGYEGTAQGLKELIDNIPVSNIIPVGQLLIFKTGENEENTVQMGDFVMGIVEGVFIQAVYVGDDPTLLESYSLISEIEL